MITYCTSAQASLPGPRAPPRTSPRRLRHRPEVYSS